MLALPNAALQTRYTRTSCPGSCLVDPRRGRPRRRVWQLVHPERDDLFRRCSRGHRHRVAQVRRDQDPRRPEARRHRRLDRPGLRPVPRHRAGRQPRRLLRQLRRASRGCKKETGGKGVPAIDGDTINFEGIAAAKPDVIFAINETIDQKTYDRLSQIAPTVVQSADYPDEETPWNVQLLTTGKALGRRRAGAEAGRPGQRQVRRGQGRASRIRWQDPGLGLHLGGQRALRDRQGRPAQRDLRRARASTPRTPSATSPRRS